MPPSITLVATLGTAVVACGVYYTAASRVRWAGIVACVLVFFVACSYIFFPFLIDLLSGGRVRSKSISPLSARELEWRSRDHETSVIPTLRIERARWAWGGVKDAETGLLVVRIEGVSFRVRKTDKKGHHVKVQKTSQSGKASTWFMSKAINLFVHHYSSLARLISIEVRDVRIIFDDLDGLELTMNTFRLGMQIEFDGTEQPSAAAGVPGSTPTMGPLATPMSPLSPLSPLAAGDKRREFPFNNLSPPSSPVVNTAFSPFDLKTPPGSGEEDDRPSRFRDARRRASVFQTRMSTTATQVLSRAIARARGSVSVTASVADVAIILPHSNPPVPMSSKPSMAEVSGKLSSNGMKTKPSVSSLKSGKSLPRSPSGRSFTFGAYRKRSTYALPNDEGGYEQLLVLKGKSTALFALGFGPRKGLLGENTLRTSLDLGILHACLGAVDKIQQLVKARKPATPSPKPRAKAPWEPTALPRVILRAFESVSVSCTKLVVSHFLPAPASQPPSASSSATDISGLASAESEFFTLSLEFSELSCRLSAADSSNNVRARNAFGTNSSPQSRVRGVGANITWQSIELHCIAPDEDMNDKSQLVSIRQAEFDAFSSWRPTGWTREEMLFDSDPNLALAVVSAKVASLGLAADVQLLDELNHAIKLSRRPRSRSQSISEDKAASPERSPRPPFQLPRFRTFFELGHISVVVADRVSKQKTTMTLASDGVSLGCYTSYSDICGRRQPSAARSAFKEEVDLQSRRKASEDSGETVDYSQPDAMLKPQYRRKYDTTAKMLDDYLVSMRGDVVAAIEPITLHMTLSGEKAREQTTFSLASIGKIIGTATGDIRGRVQSAYDGRDTIILDTTSLSSSIAVGIDSGIKVNLWDTRAVDALTALGNAHQPSVASPPRAIKPKQGSLLDRLPSGISAHVCLGTLSVFVGGADPNPNCDLKLVRGLWLQTTPTFEYAYYKYKSQGLRCRHALDQPTRKKLRLRDDITSQALAFANYFDKDDGSAALFSLCVVNTMVKPIFNGDRFAKAGGVDMVYRFEQSKPPEPQQDDFIAWEFQKRNNKPTEGTFANNVPPLDLEDTAQAQRPLIRIPHLLVNHVVQQPRPNAELEHKLTARIELVSIVADLSHLWCALLANHAVKTILDAWKRPKSQPSPTTTTKEMPNLSVDMITPHVYIHFAFPLKEQAFLSLNHVSISQLPRRNPSIRSTCVLLHVPSPTHVGAWEELGRIRNFEVVLPKPGDTPAFDINATALRICIPHNYTLSKLILNVNASVKSTKLLLENLKTGDFHTVKEPLAEDPKRVPRIQVRVETLHFEAKDHPVETNMNLAWRVGLQEQENRNQREDAFEQKLQILAETHPDLSVVGDDTTRGAPDLNDTQLTDKYTVTPYDARSRLDWYNSIAWVRRINRAKNEQRRREHIANRPFETGLQVQPPITVVKFDESVPIFRASFRGVRFKVEKPPLSRDEIIQYMGDVSSPFNKDTEFSLMVPLDLDWSMNQATVQLRDYPLPLIRIQPVSDGSKPAWNVKTLFIVAEELAGPDSVMYLPCQIVPAKCGAPDAQPFVVQIAKTIMPVKTYSRPHVKIASEKTTEFTWGNSYQPAVHDFVRVIETLSHPPRDPSSKVGFWDKFRLVLHWRVLIEFAGPCHLHLKGSFDPYSITGHGAGFAFSWRKNTRVEIAQPNPQYETIQIMSNELLVAIPDLAALKDDAAIGNNPDPTPAPSRPSDEHVSDQELIERRSTKPCARFLNGVRVGFGFQFERTCRPWTCDNCGSTDNLLHRQCRIFEFKKHQEVILRSPESVLQREQELGHAADSYEGFRSDYIHFSVSLVAGPETPEEGAQDLDAESHNSLHFSPKAFAHFFAWWKLFDHTMGLPIRQGKAFPDSGPPSKKFGRSIGTIKYRFNLAPIYVSHFYSQVSKDLWDAGKAQSLGLKARFGHFRADAHQRAQEKVVRHEKLQRITTVVHKPFYAADLQLHDIRVKGICANFNEMHRSAGPTTDEEAVPRVSELPPDLRQWYNFFDFIDANRKPFDRDPRVEMVDFGDCPHVFFSKRVKARQTTPQDDAENSVNSDPESRIDIESSKFGHERTHICYLGAARGVGPMQADITQERIKELEELLTSLKGIDASAMPNISSQRRIVEHRLVILRKHLDDLSATERRHIDDDTLQAHNTPHHAAAQAVNRQGETTFENTFHVHCPRVFFNNASRNIVYKYWFSSQDRKREEYTTSHASLRGIRDGINRRARRVPNGLNKDDLDEDYIPRDIAASILGELEKTVVDKTGGSRFKLPPDVSNDEEDLRRPSQGLPIGCIVKPNNRILVLKPQIALRSEADPSAIVLLAVEEISFKGFAVLDEQGFDQVTADVMTRNYVTLKGLQAFSPTSDTLDRGTGPRGVPRGLDFVPLEIFLDVRSEATDYDRIVLKTDAAVSFDKFNELRMPRGLEWPDSNDENGQVIRHLRIHEDLTSVIVPRVTVSATSKHYASLFYVVTDLLVYQDPAHQARSKRIESFMLTFDRKDRNPQKLLTDLFALQQSIRSLSQLQLGYENNIDLLNDTGKSELFKIRTDLLNATEELFVVFEAISVGQAKDDARAALKSLSRLDVRAGGVAWHMLRDDFKPLAKFDIERTAFSFISNKDGTSDSAIAIGELAALNSNADALFPEVLVRYEAKRKAEQRPAFATACWALMPAVGGIDIVRDLRFVIQPVRVKLESQIGSAIKAYIWGEEVKTKKGERKGNGNGDHSTAAVKHHDTVAPLSRSKSQMSVSASTVSGRSRAGTGMSTAEPPPIKHEHKFVIVSDRDVVEMRRRASTNRTFIKVYLAAAFIVLDWRGEGWIPDCTDFKLRTPELTYTNQIWSFSDMFDHVKRDVKAAGWQQTGDIVSQFLKKTTWLRDKQRRRESPGYRNDLLLKQHPAQPPAIETNLKSSKSSSHLRSTITTSPISASPSPTYSTPPMPVNIQPPTPLETEVETLSRNESLPSLRSMRSNGSSSTSNTNTTTTTTSTSAGGGGGGGVGLGIVSSHGPIVEEDEESLNSGSVLNGSGSTHGSNGINGKGYLVPRNREEGANGSTSASTLLGAGGGEEKDGEKEEKGVVGKAVKELIGKWMPGNSSKSELDENGSDA